MNTKILSTNKEDIAKAAVYSCGRAGWWRSLPRRYMVSAQMHSAKRR